MHLVGSRAEIRRPQEPDVRVTLHPAQAILQHHGCGTEQPTDRFRNSTAGEASGPHRIKWISHASGLADVAMLAPCPIGLPELPWRYAPKVVSPLPRLRPVRLIPHLRSARGCASRTLG